MTLTFSIYVLVLCNYLYLSGVTFVALLLCTEFNLYSSMILSDCNKSKDKIYTIEGPETVHEHDNCVWCLEESVRGNKKITLEMPIYLDLIQQAPPLRLFLFVLLLDFLHTIFYLA